MLVIISGLVCTAGGLGGEWAGGGGRRGSGRGGWRERLEVGGGGGRRGRRRRLRGGVLGAPREVFAHEEGVGLDARGDAREEEDDRGAPSFEVALVRVRVRVRVSYPYAYPYA